MIPALNPFRWLGVHIEWPAILTGPPPLEEPAPSRMDAYDLRPAPAPPTLPDHVPVRRAFPAGVTALQCPSCGLVWGDDVMAQCWTCHIPGEPLEDE